MERVVSWRDQAACLGVDTALFFPHSDARKTDRAQAEALCAACPVTQECLEYAQENRVPFGIWGGLTASKRQKGRPRAGPTPEHGTRARYMRGCGCGLCRKANNAYSVRYRVRAG